jgi:hypothetical protein
MKQLALLLIFLPTFGRAQAPCVGADDVPDLTVAAQALTIGSPQARTFERQFDRDIFSFRALPDTSYTVTVTPAVSGGVADTEVRVWQPDGVTFASPKASSSGARTSAQTVVPAGLVARTLYVDTRPFAEYSQGGYTLNVVANAPVDADNDGLPDAWESANGLLPGDNGAAAPFTHGPNGDPDGDRFTNLQEWLAGTDPRSSASSLRIRLMQISLLRDGVIRWSAVQNGRYNIYRGAGPNAPGWVLVGSHIQTGPSGLAEFSDPGADLAPQRSYKVELVY